MTKIYLKWDPNATIAGSPAVDTDQIKKFHNWVSPEKDGITVAVVDSGVDKNHPVFEGIDIEEHDVTGSGNNKDHIGHGTGCASLIAQLSPAVKKIVSVKVFDKEGRTDHSTLMKAYDLLNSLSDQIDIANFSLGATVKIDSLDARHNQLAAKGVRTICSSGNTGSDSGSPACADRSFSIGALTPQGEMTDFSSYDPEYDTPSICALGQNIKLARAEGTSMGEVIDDQWVKASGTSFSAPIVSAAVANYLSAKGKFDRNDFYLTADDITELPKDGEGSLNLADAMSVNEDDEEDEGKPPQISRIGVQVYGSKNLIWLRDAWLEAGSYEVEVDGDTLKIIEAK